MLLRNTLRRTKFDQSVVARFASNTLIKDSFDRERQYGRYSKTKKYLLKDINQPLNNESDFSNHPYGPHNLLIKDPKAGFPEGSTPFISEAKADSIVDKLESNDIYSGDDWSKIFECSSGIVDLIKL